MWVKPKELPMAKRKPAAENLSVICDELRSFLEAFDPSDDEREIGWFSVNRHAGPPERRRKVPRPDRRSVGQTAAVDGHPFAGLNHRPCAVHGNNSAGSDRGCAGWSASVFGK